MADPELLRWLAADPVDAIRSRDDVELVFSEKAVGGCSVYARYDGESKPPRVFLSPSLNYRRDNFTVLHEYGHHLQQTDRKWSLSVLAGLSPYERWLVEERVCDGFAASCLLPEQFVQQYLASGSVVDAVALREMYRDSSASRAACSARAVNRCADQAILVLDDRAEVFYSFSSGDMFGPGRGAGQPDVSVGVDRARQRGEDSYRLAAQTGLVAKSGKARTDVTFHVAIDGAWTFAVVTPEDSIARPTWDDFESECTNCMAPFDENSVQHCGRCSRRRCGRCGSCSCPVSRTSSICTKCSMTLSALERQRGLTSHEECP